MSFIWYKKSWVFGFLERFNIWRKGWKGLCRIDLKRSYSKQSWPRMFRSGFYEDDSNVVHCIGNAANSGKTLYLSTLSKPEQNELTLSLSWNTFTVTTVSPEHEQVSRSLRSTVQFTMPYTYHFILNWICAFMIIHDEIL